MVDEEADQIEIIERLLLLLARFGQRVEAELLEVADTELVKNNPLALLCGLDLEGPQRPTAIQELTGLSSGGVTKLIDRMVDRGLVTRSYGSLESDHRAVVVSITDEGRAIVRAMAGSLGSQLADASVLVKELALLVDL